MIQFKLNLLKIIIFHNLAFSASEFLLDEALILQRFLPDVPTTKDIVEKNGKECEVYNITTEDGYYLNLFHIPGKFSRVVLAIHGILESSDAFVQRDNISLAITLANEGYDVWLGNFRGNRYGRSHVTLDPETSTKFWNFSFHEHGYYDLPAIIDFVLNKTGQEQLTAIGHSEGNTIFYVLADTRPEYNNKVKLLIALAPIAFLQYTSGRLGMGIKFLPVLEVLGEIVNYEEVVGFYSDLKSLMRINCKVSPIAYELCVEQGFFKGAGADPAQFEPDFLDIFIDHFPGGTSRKNLVHFGQVGRRNEFARYDYGFLKNIKYYGSATPPKYNLSKVTMDVALYKGRNDLISTLKDVARLRGELPNVVEDRTLDYDLWNHIDHIIGLFMPKYLYPHIKALLAKYN